MDDIIILTRGWDYGTRDELMRSGLAVRTTSHLASAIDALRNGMPVLVALPLGDTVAFLRSALYEVPDAAELLLVVSRLPYAVGAVVDPSVAVISPDQRRHLHKFVTDRLALQRDVA